ncbi:MAG: sterol desaturase family protein [Myxococcota bacterium]
MLGEPSTDLWTTAQESFVGYARWVASDLTELGWGSYASLLVAVSAFAFFLERIRPWRRDQALWREDFGLDAFYMVFNFFGFGLLGYVALSDVAAALVMDARRSLGLAGALVDVSGLPHGVQLVLLFVLRDLVHYGIHRLLHRVPWLWRFHEVHHSVREMGFAAHLRYHPMETVVYRSLEYAPLALVGFGPGDFFVVHAFSLLVGHLNHANVSLPLGPLRYVLNSSRMHLWHHAKDLPEERMSAHGGVNFGLTLSVWDHLFGTAHWPRDDAALELGFAGVERYPRGFFGHLWAPFRPAGGDAQLGDLAKRR